MHENTVDREMAHFDFQDADTEEFFRKGLQDMYEDWDAARLTNALMQYGSYLIYRGEFSNRDAAMLRRLFSARPPVRILYINISHGAFRIAFDGQWEWPSLRKIHFDRIDCEGQDLGIDRCEVLKNVRSLDLGSVNVGRGFAQEVASYIRQNESLEELWLHVSCSPDNDIGPIIESLKVNNTLREFGLNNLGYVAQIAFGTQKASSKLSADVLMGFAEMLASNSTLQLVDVRDSFPIERDMVSSLLAQEEHAGVFKRICIEWPEQLLPELTELIRNEACCPKLHVIVSSFVDERVLREFLDAVVAFNGLLELHIFPNHGQQSPFERKHNVVAQRIASLLRRTTTLREISCYMHADQRHLIPILHALKRNTSVTKFVIDAVALTGELMKSLSKLLVVNKTLVYVCILYSIGGLPREVEDVLQALKTNYTLTTLDFGIYSDHYPQVHEINVLLQRNVLLKNRAAQFVTTGADINDEEGVDALRKVQESSCLVEEVQELTGKTSELALQEIRAALARLPM